jgi:hypothetical protein
VSPILGIFASAQQGAFDLGDYQSISTVTVGGGGSATISFTSIPSTYQHLQLRFSASSNTVSGLRIRFNSDTGSNYAWHQLYGTSTTVIAGSGASQASIALSYDNKADVSFPVPGVTDILDYANTNKNKTIRALSGTEQNNSDGLIIYRSGLWMNTSAITSISIFLDSGSFNQYSSFALYGIKG